MSDVVDVRAERIDAPHSRTLIVELQRDLNARYGVVAEPLGDSYLDELSVADSSPPNGVFVLAWRDGEPVGCGALRPGFGPRAAEVKRMYVRPDARRLGISRLVLAALESHASALGYERLELETGIEQPEAIALYESSGWTPIAGYGPYADHPWTRCYGKAVSGNGDVG